MEIVQQHWLLILVKIELAIRIKVQKVIKIVINGFHHRVRLKVAYGMVQVDASLLKIALNSKELLKHVQNTQPWMDHA